MGVTISMDGKGRCMDNIFVERLWRSLKYEEVYLNAYATVAEATAGIGSWLEFYNTERQHQSLGYRPPRHVYQEDLWICGRSALPTGCASPASRASSEGGEMLAFAHIPTGTATNNEFDIDEMNSRGLKPAVASAPEPISKPAGLHLSKRLRLSHDRGPPNLCSGQTGVQRGCHSQQMSASRVNFDKLPMSPPDRILGRHTLHRLRIHIGDDVLGHDLGCRPVRRPGIACSATDLRDGAEWEHDRVVLPQRMVLPLCCGPECETLLRGEPLVEHRLRVNPAQEVLRRLLIL